MLSAHQAIHRHTVYTSFVGSFAENDCRFVFNKYEFLSIYRQTNGRYIDMTTHLDMPPLLDSAISAVKKFEKVCKYVKLNSVVFAWRNINMVYTNFFGGPSLSHNNKINKAKSEHGLLPGPELEMSKNGIALRADSWLSHTPQIYMNCMYWLYIQKIKVSWIMTVEAKKFCKNVHKLIAWCTNYVINSCASEMPSWIFWSGPVVCQVSWLIKKLLSWILWRYIFICSEA